MSSLSPRHPAHRQAGRETAPGCRSPGSPRDRATPARHPLDRACEVARGPGQSPSAGSASSPSSDSAGIARCGSMSCTYRPPRIHDAAAAIRQATIAKSNASTRPCGTGPRSGAGRTRGRSGGGVSRPGAWCTAGRAAWPSGCSRGTRRTARRPAAGARRGARRPAARRARPGRRCSVRGQRRREADDHQREEDADREHHRRVLERREHAGADAALRAAAALFMIPALVGRREQAHRRCRSAAGARANHP